MTEDRSDNDHADISPDSLEPKPQDAAAGPKLDPKRHRKPSLTIAKPKGEDNKPIPNLLPEGFRGGISNSPQKARLDPVELARVDRDVAHRKERRQRQAKRHADRHARKRLRERLARIDKVTMALMTAVLVLAPLAIGSVHLITIVPLALMAMLALGGAVGIRHLQQEPLRVGLLGWTLLGLTCVTFIQAMPLPLGLIDALSPQIAQWVRYAFEATSGGPPGTASLSLQPGEAARAGFGLLTATALYVAAFNLLGDKERFQKMLLLMPAIGAALVVIGVIQKVVGAEGLLLFYKPRDLAELPFFSSTFVNPNHLASLLGMLSFIPLGLSMSQDFKVHRATLVIAFGICTAGLVMTLSASALVAWTLGLLAFGALTLRRRVSSRKGVTVGIVVAICGVGLGLWAAWTKLAEQTSFLVERQGLLWVAPTELWAQGWQMAQQNPWLGLGRASFSDAFAATEHPNLPGRMDYVGNTYLQVLIDYGLPLGALIIIAVAAAVLPLGMRRGWKKEDLPVMTGLFGAFAFLGMDAATGFSLEIPGVLLPAVFLLALARSRDARYEVLRQKARAHRAERRRQREGLSQEDTPDQDEPQLEPPPWRRLLPVAALAAVALLSLFSLPAAMDTATGGPMHSLKSLIAKPNPQPEAIDRATRAVLARRPAYSPAYLSAYIGYRSAGQPDQGRAALERARDFDRSNPAPWLLMARDLLGQNKRTKALEHYRRALELACQTEGDGRGVIAEEVARIFADPKEVAAAMPARPEVWTHLLDKLLEDKRPGRVLDITTAMLETINAPEDRRIIHIRVAQAEAALGRWPRAHKVASGLLEPAPAPAAAYVVLTLATTHLKTPAQALEVALEGIKHHPRDVELLFTATELLIDHAKDLGAKDEGGAWARQVDKLLQSLRPYAIQRSQLRWRFYRLSALYAMVRGQTPAAIRDLTRALELNADDPQLTIALAQMLEKERQVDQAIHMYQRAVQRFPDHPQAAELRQSLERLQSQKSLRDRFRSGQ